MSSSSEKSPESESFLKSQTVIYSGIVWGILSLFLFVTGIVVPDIGDSLGYLIGTYVAECVPFLCAVALCYRNWRSPKIMSGRNVWLLLGLGILSYFIADLVFGFWEVYWGLDPEVSPADLFYMSFYIFLVCGMLLAVLSRRLNLEGWQWATLSIIAVIGTTFAVWVALAQPVSSTDLKFPEVVNVPAVETAISTPDSAIAEIEENEGRTTPDWVLATEETLLPFSTPINFFYIICDVGLLIIAAMLLLAFWGGTFSLSWRMIAAAAFAKYVADMWFKYAATLPTEYESGGLLEVFFVFSGILLAIGAALEYDVSSRPRKRRRRSNSKTEVA
ncbi:hypothetical protein IQ249_19705 [Lusitaniella coriacea LEGE 07157]|uniref:Uncharacterized protein n=1 Tax=Lusitaniella coriacea LEGE 07157 TaxID=945747 RepID=A0A8J7IWL1_9CYAN|nr:hypothetical protein [Lusitaniella coriacea]MBE9118123.1 hypothetical protein [Lusitaniella coriacea LEGE 07157]